MEELIRQQADKTLADATIQRIRRRAVIDFLMAKRAAQGINQSEIAKKMGCSQSRISKLENGTDDELNLGDLREYCNAIGLDYSLVLTKRDAKIADMVKYHVLSVRRLLRRLADLVADDQAMKLGMEKLCVEVIVNNALSVAQVSQGFEAFSRRKKFPAELPPVMDIEGESEQFENDMLACVK